MSSNHNDRNVPHEVRHARGSDGRTPTAGVVRQLSELARELQAEPDMASLFDHIVAATVAEIDGAEQGGITLVDHGTVRAVAATAALVNQMDQLQNDLNDGPCLSSLRKQITVRANDLATESRWPRFVAAAVEHGVRAMLSVQLFVEGDNLGALNLYSSTPGAFTEHDEYTAMALAAHAAVAMKGSTVESNLRIALVSRDVIGQAKGILMERYKIDQEQAFGLLVLSSQRTHTKLRDVAERLTATGELRVKSGK